jgi:putative transposase
MGRKIYSPEQIIVYFREAEILLYGDITVLEIFRKIGIAEQAYYRWRKK